MRQLNFGLPISIDEKNGEVRLGKDILCESAAAKNFSGIKHLAYNEGEADDNEHCYTSVSYTHLSRQMDFIP